MIDRRIIPDLGSIISCSNPLAWRWSEAFCNRVTCSRIEGLVKKKQLQVALNGNYFPKIIRKISPRRKKITYKKSVSCKLGFNQEHIRIYINKAILILNRNRITYSSLDLQTAKSKKKTSFLIKILILDLELMIHIRGLLLIAMYQRELILRLFVQIGKIYSLVVIIILDQCSTNFKLIWQLRIGRLILARLEQLRKSLLQLMLVRKNQDLGNIRLQGLVKRSIQQRKSEDRRLK